MAKTNETDSNIPGSTGPVGDGNYEVDQGESVSSIVSDTGLNWKKVWGLPENQALKQSRGDDPDALLPGDMLYIPKCEQKEEDCQTDTKRRFKKLSTTTLFRMAFEDYDGPRAGEDYLIKFNRKIIKEGKLNDEGGLEVIIPCHVKTLVVVLGKEPSEEEFMINLGMLDPVTELTGVQDRLNHLGYRSGSVDNKMGPLTRAAVMRFQDDHSEDEHKLAVDGIPGPYTQAALDTEHQTTTYKKSTAS